MLWRGWQGALSNPSRSFNSPTEGPKSKFTPGSRPDNSTLQHHVKFSGGKL